MPFCDDLDWLRDEIVKAGSDTNVTVQRADDISLPGVVLDQVLEAIRQADVVIAVCTGRNANVFFELGYAWHTHNSVLVASSDEDLPFDVSHLRTEFYGKPGSGQDRATIRQRLTRAIQASVDSKSASAQEVRTEPPADMRERMDALVNGVQTEAAEAALPVIYLAIVPHMTYERLFQPDRPTTRAISQLSEPPVFGIDEYGKVIFGFVMPKYKGVALDESDVRLFGYNWMEFYNDGSFIGVITGSDSVQPGIFAVETQPTPGFYDNMVTSQVVARLRAFGLLANHFNMNNKVTIRLGVANIALPITMSTGPYRLRVRSTQVLDSPVHTDLSMSISDDLTTIGGVLRTAVTLLNDLMTAFQWPRCFQLEPDGSVVLSTWGSEWKPNVEHWVQQNNILSVDDYEE